MPKDSEHLTLVPPGLVPPGPSEPIPPPSVPAGLSEAEAKLWTQVVDSKPSGWFDGGSSVILKEFVRASAACDFLAAVIAGAGPEQLKPLLDLRDREARRAVSLATKLRLTPQSKYDPRGAATADKRVKGIRPWRTPDEPGAS